MTRLQATNENCVYALLGRAVLLDCPSERKLRVFVLWGDKQQITPELAKHLNKYDPEANFDLLQVKRLITTLPTYKITSNSERPDKGPRVWWNLQIAAQKSQIVQKTERCRVPKVPSPRIGNDIMISGPDTAIVQGSHLVSAKPALPANNDEESTMKHTVYALLGRVELLDRPWQQQLQVFVLWSNKQITLERAKDLNSGDPEANFDLLEVWRLVTTLPTYKITAKSGEPEKGPRVWWNLQIPEQKDNIVHRTQQCRSTKAPSAGISDSDRTEEGTPRAPQSGPAVPAAQSGSIGEPATTDVRQPQVEDSPPPSTASPLVRRQKARVRREDKDKLAMILHGVDEAGVWHQRVWGFIALNRPVLGNRRVEVPWAGSVLDSVIASFLTQHVTDHFSAAAFIDLYARFKANTPRTCHRRAQDAGTACHTGAEAQQRQGCSGFACPRAGGRMGGGEIGGVAVRPPLCDGAGAGSAEGGHGDGACHGAGQAHAPVQCCGVEGDQGKGKGKPGDEKRASMPLSQSLQGLAEGGNATRPGAAVTERTAAGHPMSSSHSQSLSPPFAGPMPPPNRLSSPKLDLDGQIHTGRCEAVDHRALRSPSTHSDRSADAVPMDPHAPHDPVVDCEPECDGAGPDGKRPHGRALPPEAELVPSPSTTASTKTADASNGRGNEGGSFGQPPAQFCPEHIDWQSVIDAGQEQVARTIQGRGMQNMIAGYICDFLKSLRSGHIADPRASPPPASSPAPEAVASVHASGDSMAHAGVPEPQCPPSSASVLPDVGMDMALVAPHPPNPRCRDHPPRPHSPAPTPAAAMAPAPASGLDPHAPAPTAMGPPPQGPGPTIRASDAVSAPIARALDASAQAPCPATDPQPHPSANGRSDIASDTAPLRRDDCLRPPSAPAAVASALSLEWLRHVSPAETEAYLLGIPRLGPKCSACVRLLTLRQQDFPADVNVARICSRLGWIPLEANVAVEELDDYAPEPAVQRFLRARLGTLSVDTLTELHYQMITFGKVLCTKRLPNCGACPMRPHCEYAQNCGARFRLDRAEVPACSGDIEDIDTDPPDRDPARAVTAAWPSVLLSRGAARPATPWVQAIPDRHRCISHVFGVRPSLTGALPPWLPAPDCHEQCPYLAIVWTNARPHSGGVKPQTPGPMHPPPQDAAAPPCGDAGAAAPLPPSAADPSGSTGTDPNALGHAETPPSASGTDCPPHRTADSVAQEALLPGTPSNGAAPSQGPVSVMRGPDTVWVTLLIPCRSALQGRFPLNGTFFQTNEVFLDVQSLNKPLAVPVDCLEPAPVRLYTGTSLTSLCRGMTQPEITALFGASYICTRAFDFVKVAQRGLPKWLSPGVSRPEPRPGLAVSAASATKSKKAKTEKPLLPPASSAPERGSN